MKKMQECFRNVIAKIFTKTGVVRGKYRYHPCMLKGEETMMKRRTKFIRKLFLIACLGSVLMMMCCCTAGATEENSDVQKNEKTDTSSYTDTYTCIGLYLDGHYLSDEDFFHMTTTLNADGSGEIDWGENNFGPISEWSVEDDRLLIKAGLSEIEGRLKDGVMVLDLGDGYQLAMLGQNVDRETLGVVPMDDYLKQHPEAMAALTGDSGVDGIYYPFALGDGEYYISREFTGDDGVITLNEDGTGIMVTGTVENAISWTWEDAVFTMFDESGTIPVFSGTIQDGILTLDMSVRMENGQTQTRFGYFAVKDADLSAYTLISPEDYQSLKK